MTCFLFILKLGVLCFCALGFAQDELIREDVKINTLSNEALVKKVEQDKPSPSLPMNVLTNETYIKPLESVTSTQVAKVEEEKEEIEEIVTSYKGKFSLMSFFTVSTGDFKETAKNGNAINTEQNSPATLGLFGNYRPHKRSYSWQGSFYASMLKGSQTSFSQQVDPPTEYGVNLYLQKEMKLFNWSTGIDYERFSNYSADNISADGKTAIKNQTITFLTLGIGRFIPLGKWNLLTKLSLSTSVAQSDFGGQKGIIYLGLFSPWKWQVHVMYKHHKLESDAGNKLTIGRLGIGVGYLFF